MNSGAERWWSVGAVLALSWGAAGCASQRDTARTLSTLGVVAVVVGSEIAEPDQCRYEQDYVDPHERDGRCVGRPTKKERDTGVALMAAGAGLSIVGKLLEEDDASARDKSRGRAVAAPTQTVQRPPGTLARPSAPGATTATPAQAKPEREANEPSLSGD